MALLLDQLVSHTFAEDSGDAAAGSGTIYELASSPVAGAYGRQVFIGSLETSGDEDWVSVFSSRGVLALRVEGVGASALSDPVIEFVDAAGVPVAANSWFEQDTDGFKLFQFIGKEDRFIRVSSKSGTGTGDYSFEYTFAADHSVGTEFGDQPSLVSPTLYYGLGGNDYITQGRASGDTILGGDGDDRMVMGDADDSLFGEAGNDVIHDGGGDNFISGGDGNDRVLASDGADTLRGGDGDDTLRSENGNDVLAGGDGADELRGNDGVDTVLYDYATRRAVVDLENEHRNAGAAAGDRIWSVEIIRGTTLDDGLFGNQYRNVLKGNDGNDTLFGRGGTDKLIGGRGDDHLKGGLHTDRLTGGEGADTFIFRAGDGDDFITDFNAAEDILRLQGLTSAVVSNDGTDTTVSYGGDSVTLLGVALTEGEITFDYV